MDPEGSGPSQDEIGLPEDSGDRANAAIVQGMVEGVQSKDTTPLTPEEEQLQQTIDKLKAQNDQLGGYLITTLKSNTGEFYVLNSTAGRGQKYAAVGIDSERGPIIVTGLVAQELGERAGGSKGEYWVKGDNIDDMVKRTASEMNGGSKMSLVQSESDIGLFGGIYDEAVKNAGERKRQAEIRRQFVPRTLDIVNRGDAAVTAAAAGSAETAAAATPVAAGVGK